MTRSSPPRRNAPPPPRRGRLTPWVLVAGLIAAALFYLRCGDGLGFGRGDGTGTGARKDESSRTDRPATATGAVAAGAAGRCQLRLDATGLHLDGATATTEKAVRACKAAGGAELVATGDAVFGELERVRAALDAAGVSVFVRDPAAGTQAPAP
jgi:hypothetical protein